MYPVNELDFVDVLTIFFVEEDFTFRWSFIQYPGTVHLVHGASVLNIKPVKGKFLFSDISLT